jgi:TolA-binding protein
MLEDFLADNPGSETADRLRYRQAMNRYQSGDYEAAVDEFRQYIRITNRDDLLPDAWYNLADAQQRMNREDDAIESYRRIADDFADSERAPAAIAELGSLMISRGDYNEASGYFERLLDYGSRFRDQAYLGMGEAALGRNNYSEARGYYESVLEDDSDHQRARLGIAKVESAEGNHSRAIELAREVADQSSEEAGAEALYLVGRSYQEQRNYDEALEAYAQVSVLFEPYIDWVTMARYRRAEIYILQNRRGDATRILEELRDDYPGTEAAERASRLLNRN